MITLPNYQLIKIIGSGSFGYVFQAFDKTRQKKVALKRIQKVSNQLSRQYEVLSQIKDCPYVVKIVDFFYSKTDQNQLIQNIVLEYCQNNLEGMIQKKKNENKHFSFKQIKNYIRQILKGLQYIHQKNIAHRDLKPENVLFNQGTVKICDFGSSKWLDKKGKNTPYIVSRYYRAPQLMLCITNYTTAIDIWAAGCILAELVLLQPIFKGKSQGDQLFAIFRVLGSMIKQQIAYYAKIVPFDPQIFKKFPEYSVKNIKEEFSNAGFKNNKYELLNDLLKKMFCYIPEQRITAKQALKHQFFNIQ